MFNTPAAMSLAYSGNISGSGTGAVTKSGPGTVVLSGSNTQPGGLTVNGGVSTLNAAQSYGGATTISAGTLKSTRSPAPCRRSAGLSYHLDASNIANLTLGAGNVVSGWTDSSGNGVNFLQNAARPPNRPMWPAGSTAWGPSASPAARDRRE